MNIKAFSLFFGVFVFLFLSCTEQKVIRQTKTRVIKDTIYIEKVQKKSIIHANPRSYKVNKEFFPSKMQNSRVRFLVLHYTSTGFDHSVGLLTGDLGVEVSSHYLINDTNDKDIHLLVDEKERAWHAGKSYWRKRENINDSSIGIEIVNEGFTEANGVQDFFDYPNYQIKKVAKLSKDIVERYEIDPTNVIGHSDVAPQRKFDPGPKFPWERLHKKYGIGAWYDDPVKKDFMNRYDSLQYNNYDFILQTQKDLNRYGYKIEFTGNWDKQTQKVIMAFQHHFRPQNYNGFLDTETWAILQALLSKYR